MRKPAVDYRAPAYSHLKLQLGLLAEIILYRDYWKEKWGLFQRNKGIAD